MNLRSVFLLPRLMATALVLTACPAWCGQPAAAQTSGSADLAHQAQLYATLYEASSIRNLRFSETSNPQQSIKQEVYLDAQLAKRAEAEGIDKEAPIESMIKLRTEGEIMNSWLRSQVPEDRITSDRVTSYYQSHRDEFTQPVSVVFHHLFLLVDPATSGSELTKQQEAEVLYKQAAQAADFEELVVAKSELAAAQQDKGKVGPVELARLNKALQAPLRELKPGEVSHPVRTPYGWELLKLDSRSSASVIPFEQVRQSIVEKLYREEALKVQEQATRFVQGKYPAVIDEKALEADPILTGSAIVRIGDKSWNAEQLLTAIEAADKGAAAEKPADKIRDALPRFTLTQQVLLAATDAGLTNSPDLQTKLQLIRNRALAEEFMSRFHTDREPTDEQLRNYYASRKELFRGPPYAKGTVYKWFLPEASTSGSAASPQDMTFRLNTLMESVAKLVEKAEAGKITRDQVARDASETTSLDWFREGPLGYHHDMAWFKAKPGHFTQPYRTKNGIAVGWVEAMREPQQFTYEEAKDQVRGNLLAQWSQEDRRKLIQDILKQMPQ